MKNQKIDCVIQYLDPTDLNWMQSYIENTGDKNKLNKKMYDNQTMLFKYVIRGVAKHFSFIDKLHLIVFDRSQIPDWLNQDTVNVILHKDFIPSKFLPTFNSTTPQIFIGNLPDTVSNNFILMSDDFYIINDIKQDYFFDAEYNPIVEKLVKMPLIDNPWYLMVERSNNLAKKIFQRDDKIYRWHHFPHAFNKNGCKAIFEKNEQLLTDTISMVRDPNINIATLFWVVATYFMYGKMNSDDIGKILDENSSDVFSYKYPNIMDLKRNNIKCLNMNYIDPVDIPKLRDQFDQIFPGKCKYEK